MTLNDFKELITNINTIDNRNDILYKNGVNIISFVDLYHKILYDLGCAAFGVKKWDFVEWYLYEAPSFKDKTVPFIIDGVEYEINSIEKLYELLNIFDND